MLLRHDWRWKFVHTPELEIAWSPHRSERRGVFCGETANFSHQPLLPCRIELARHCGAYTKMWCHLSSDALVVFLSRTGSRLVASVWRTTCGPPAWRSAAGRAVRIDSFLPFQVSRPGRFRPDQPAAACSIQKSISFQLLRLIQPYCVPVIHQGRPENHLARVRF